MTKANLIASRVVRSYGKSSRSRPCHKTLILASVSTRVFGCSFLSFGRSVARVGVWRAGSVAQHLEGDGLRALPSTTYLPAAMSFDNVAISSDVTSRAIMWPSRGLTRLHK